MWKVNIFHRESFYVYAINCLSKHLPFFLFEPAFKASRVACINQSDIRTWHPKNLNQKIIGRTSSRNWIKRDFRPVRRISKIPTVIYILVSRMSLELVCKIRLADFLTRTVLQFFIKFIKTVQVKMYILLTASLLDISRKNYRTLDF